MKRLLALAALIPTLALAGYGSATIAQITSVYDVDTFRADIENWQPITGERIPIRVLGGAPSRCKTQALKRAHAKLL